MNGPAITIAMTGDRSGLIVASLPRQSPYVMGERLIVGDVSCWCPDGTPEERAEWKAILWPVAGGNFAVTQSCKAIVAGSVERLQERLQGLTGKDGPWWTAPDGRCVEVLEHGGRTSRCETAAAVAHDVHRHLADGVEWMTEEDYERSLDEPSGGAA